MNNSKPQTPLEKLKAEKERIRQETKEQELRMNQHITYVQSNAGSLLLSFASSMLFPSHAKKNAALPSSDNLSVQAGEAGTGKLSLADFLPLTKLLLPTVWEMSKPILISWGIKKATSLASGLFSRKKHKSKN